MATIYKKNGKFRVQIRRNGHRLTKTFHRKMDADAWSREQERAVDQGRDPSLRPATRRDTLGGLIDLHITDLAAVGKPLRRSKRAVLDRLKRELGGTALPNLTRERLVMYGRQRAKDGAGPATVSIDISFIGTVLTHAAAVHGIQVNTEAVALARVALRRLDVVGRSIERDRRPTDAELEKLFGYFEAADRSAVPMVRIIQFAIASAMRLDEIFRIEWDTLNHRNRTIVVPDRKDPRKKDGNDQRVPLLGVTGYDAYALLMDQRALGRNEPRCFPYAPKTAARAFQRACQALGIHDLHFHDFRHEATSRLFEAGLTIEQVPLVTGHKEWKMLQRYTQLRPENLYAKLSQG